MKNLLVIAFHYPPDNTSTGVLRTYKFTEYLLQHQWNAHVITVPSALYVSRNPAGADIIPPQITVERAWGCDIKQAVAIRGVYPAWLGIPDRYWPWFFAARSAGARAIREGRINAIYSTYPIPTAHLIGLSLHRRFKLPWIADFRDPWAVASETGLRARIEAVLERKVIESADRVICNTAAMRRHFLQKYPDVPGSKFVTITNGYDEADFAGIVAEPTEKFQILYPGILDLENRDPRGLLAAIALALQEGKLDRNDLHLTFLGCGDYGGSAQFARQLDEFGLRSVTEVVATRIPYKHALRRLAGADVLVALSSQHEQLASELDWTAMQVPAKVYEYLRLGRPMLPLVAGGAVAEVLEQVGGFSPLAPSDTEAIAARLGALYAKRDHPPRSAGIASEVSRYSRENLTAALAVQLDALVC